MAEIIHMTVVLRKIVLDLTEAHTLHDAIKAKLADRPDIGISASIGVSLDQPEPEIPL